MPVLAMSDVVIRNLAAPPKTTDYYDRGRGSVKNLLLKVSTGGARTFYLLYRLKGKGSRQHKIGRYPAMGLADARIEARKLEGELEKNPNFFAEQKQAKDEAEHQTFSVVLDEFDKRHVQRKKLRTGRVMIQIAKKHLLPKFKERDFNSIRRKEIVAVLDRIEDKHGPSMADSVLGVYRSMASFQMGRDEDYRSPLAKNMRRYQGKARDRVLTDAEIKAFWNATTTANLGIFGGLCRVLLLTGARRAKVNHMRHSDVQAGIWTLGREDDNEKPNAGQIHLPALALSIIDSQPKIAGNPHCFPGTRLRGPFSAWGKSTEQLFTLMRKELPDMPDFVIHDLRRTFRSRCSLIGVPREIAERCLGHVIGNQIERTYDRHRYIDEMTAAFAAVADHIAGIVTPPPGSNVVPLRREPRQARQAPPPAAS